MDVGKIPVPPLPPPLPSKITREQALKRTIIARQRLFEEEKEKTYHAIYYASQKGEFIINYIYPENCNREDIIRFQKELKGEGFEVTLENGIKDKLEIAWY